MGPVSATAIEANNRGEGGFRSDQRASTTSGSNGLGNSME